MPSVPFRSCGLLIVLLVAATPRSARAFDTTSNDTIATAESINDYTLARGRLTDSSDHDDYFAVTADEGVLEVWLLDYASGTNTFALTLEDATSTLDTGASGVSSTGLFLDYTLTTAGTY